MECPLLIVKGIILCAIIKTPGYNGPTSFQLQTLIRVHHFRFQSLPNINPNRLFSSSMRYNLNPQPHAFHALFQNSQV